MNAVTAMLLHFISMLMLIGIGAAILLIVVLLIERIQWLLSPLGRARVRKALHTKIFP